MTATFHSTDALLDALAGTTFDRPPVLVSNAHITGLGVARALSAHDVPVIALDRTSGGVAWPSNTVDFAGSVTYPLDDREGFRQDIEAIVDAVGSEVVAFGCMDEWVHAYAATEPDGVRLPSSPVDVVDRVLNKTSLYAIAEDLGVPYPETYRLDAVSPATVLERLEFPFVIKPALKREFEEAIGTNVVEVADEAAFDDIVARAADAGIDVMAQERVPIARGEDRSLVSYVPPTPDGLAGAIDDALAIVGNPTVRYPLDFGTSCVVDRVEDPTIERRALAVLAEAGYFGISEAEFVYDRDRGKHVLLDINTRPWKWISMPVAAGENLPMAAYADAIGIDRPASGDRAEMRWIYLRDYLALLAGDNGLSDVVTPAQWRALASGTFEATGSTLTTGVYRPTDPGPTAKLIASEAASEEYYCAC